MTHSFRQNNLRLMGTPPAAKDSGGKSLLLIVLCAVLGFGGVMALSDDPAAAARRLWSNALEVTGISARLAPPSRATPAPETRYAICGFAPHRNCVIDGDTFYLGEESIRLADIDAPETHPARCRDEAQLGERATQRLHELLNEGPIELRLYERDRDVYGRKLRVVARDGQSLGRILIAEGLARPWTGRRQPWCG